MLWFPYICLGNMLGYYFLTIFCYLMFKLLTTSCSGGLSMEEFFCSTLLSVISHILVTAPGKRWRRRRDNIMFVVQPSVTATWCSSPSTPASVAASVWKSSSASMMWPAYSGASVKTSSSFKFGSVLFQFTGDNLLYTEWFLMQRQTLM